MKKFFVLFVLMLVAIAGLVASVGAQDQGGAIIWGNQRGSANLGPIVPIRCSGVDCADLYYRMYPVLVGLNPETLTFERYTPGSMAKNALATDWEISNEGKTYTFTLRDDLTWSDGEPVTAEDVAFTFRAIEAGEEVGLSSSFGPTRADVESVEVIDDYTIAVNFEAANCLALNRAGVVYVSPAHAYGYDGSEDFDFSIMNGHPEDTEPSITSGAFQFERVEAGTAVYLTADQSFPDTEEGYVVPEGIVYLDVPDYNVMAERMIAGQPNDVNYIHEPSTSIFTTLREADNVEFFDAPGTVWHYVALNVADPSNPQNGLDENGEVIDQGHHPILGDVRVRQALQHAVDIDEVIANAQNGNASPMVVGTIPNAFTIHPTLERRAYNMDEARRLLDEAGWVSTGEPLVDGGDGLRTCQGCMYAEEGTEMFLDIMAPDQPRTDAAVILQASFAVLGIDLEVRTLDFNTMYDGNMGTQTFDMAVAGWRGSVPFDADQRDFFGVEQDIAGDGSEEYGFNFGSWYNAEFEELGEYVATGATADGCAVESIQEAAYRMQEIMWEEQPYLFLYAQNVGYAVHAGTEGFQPFPAQGNWNMDAWRVPVQE